MANVPNGTYRIFCAGDEGNKRWLVTDSSNVKVARDTAVFWQLTSTEKGMTISSNEKYMDGNTRDGKVRLTSLGSAGSGVYWDIEVSGQYYVLQCLGTGSGDKRFLDGKTNESKVYLNDDTEKSGSQWLLIPA